MAVELRDGVLKGHDYTQDPRRDSYDPFRPDFRQAYQHREIMYYEKLKSKILDNSAHIVVMGLGYVGLPLASELALFGYRVTGFDPDRKKVDRVNRGESYVEYPSSSVVDQLRDLGRLSASTNPGVLEDADIILICVPTPLNKERQPDLSMVRSAARVVQDRQRPGQLVVLESTSYPGTTREILVPDLTTLGHSAGETVFIGYSPERIDPGNKDYGLTNTPKVVAGMTEKCGDLVELLYSRITKAVRVSSPEVAEMSKIVENTFRQVNIGLANEMALMCRKLKIDPFEVIDAAKTKPFGFMPFYPGIGVGGHCIKPDPLYLSWKVKALEGQAKFIDLADEINGQMPDHAVSVCIEALNSHQKSVNGSKILVLGVAYKPNVGDVRESPVIPFIQKLQQMGALVSYQDPWVPELHEGGVNLPATSPDHYYHYDLVAITTPHRDFEIHRVLQEAPLVVDTKGVLRDYRNKPLMDPKIYRI